MNKIYCVLVIIIFSFSCNKNQKTAIAKEEGAIFSLLIDELASPFPPPPPPPRDGSEPEPINMDSLNNVNVRIVVDTIMISVNEEIDLPVIYDGFQHLVDSINKLSEKPVNQGFVKSKEGHYIIFGNSLDDFEGKYSQMARISRIVFNEERNMAAVYAGHSTHPLAGYFNLYLLRKIDGEWKIIFKKNISVS